MTTIQKQTLLYVEDKEVIALAATVALEETGTTVVQSGNGSAALHDSAASYHLLLTDVRLPEVDGWQIATCSPIASRHTCDLCL